MKTIGLLGGVSWLSTMNYYEILHKLVEQKLGKSHTPKIILKNFDSYEIRHGFGKNDDQVASLFQQQFLELTNLKPDCILICCNTLHKYYDMIKDNVFSDIPVFHAVELVALEMKKQLYKTALLLATKNTLEDGFFAKKLEKHGIKATIPNKEERLEINKIKNELMENIVTKKSKSYFNNLIANYNTLNAVILGCSVFPLVVNKETSLLPIINPMYLQAIAATEFALEMTPT